MRGSVISAGQRQYSNVRQIAIAFRVVKPVADYEFIRNRKTNIIGGHVSQATLHFIQQDRDAQILRLALLQNAQEIAERETSIQDILHYDDSFALDAGVEVLVEFHLARGT